MSRTARDRTRTASATSRRGAAALLVLSGATAATVAWPAEGPLPEARAAAVAPTSPLTDELAPSPWVRAPRSGHRADAAGLAPTPGFFAPPEAFLAQERECTGQSPDRFYEFYFTRAIYNNDRGGGFGRRGGRRGGSWSVDYPKADCQFITVVKRLAGLDMFYDSNAISLDDPELRRFPFLYALEVGAWSLSESEAQGLRDYLDAGGFLVIDDFWGTQEWYGFERGIRQVIPDRPIVDVPLDHTVFSIFYTIDQVLQVPNVGNGEAVSYGIPGARTYESDGYVPAVKGIFDDEGRLMVIINWNTDLGDAWEWAEQPSYPLEFSTFAFEMGVNMILYSMTH